MGRPRKDDSDILPVPSRPPALSPQARENQLINLTVDLAEKQLREGTASQAVVGHFLKLATSRENLEREKLKNENLLLQARVNAISSEGNMRELLETALDAFRGYQSTQHDGEYID